jgi:hypothetical protein
MLDRSKWPARIARLPLDERGFPVPKFVTWINGKADFRLADTQWTRRAMRERRCFLCGEPLGRFMAFVIGPMCAVNRTTSEPPCHKDCAEFAVQSCPFICFPNRDRNPHDLPETKVKPAGYMITRNPGVALVWITKQYEVMASAIEQKHGALLHIGEAVSKSWWCRGRPATRDEVLASIESGIPELQRIARELDGLEGLADLEIEIAKTIKNIQEEPWLLSPAVCS